MSYFMHKDCWKTTISLRLCGFLKIFCAQILKNPIFAVSLRNKFFLEQWTIFPSLIWSSLLDQSYEQNILELANSEGVLFQVGWYSQKMAVNA